MLCNTLLVLCSAYEGPYLQFWNSKPLDGSSRKLVSDKLELCNYALPGFVVQCCCTILIQEHYRRRNATKRGVCKGIYLTLSGSGIPQQNPALPHKKAMTLCWCHSLSDEVTSFYLFRVLLCCFRCCCCLLVALCLATVDCIFGLARSDSVSPDWGLRLGREVWISSCRLACIIWRKGAASLHLPNSVSCKVRRQP